MNGLTRSMAAVALVLLAGRIAGATPPLLPEKSEQAKALIQKVEALDREGDVEGLLDALKQAHTLARMEQGWIVGPIIDALKKIDVEKLKDDRVVAALTVEMENGYSGAVQVLARIGTPGAGRVILEAAKSNPHNVTRCNALVCLGQFDGAEARGILLGVVCDRTEKEDCRRSAMTGLERTSLTEPEYRTVLETVVRAPEDPFAAQLFRIMLKRGETRTQPGSAFSTTEYIGDPVGMAPLLDVLRQLSRRLEEVEKDDARAAEREALGKCLDRGFSSLHGILNVATKRAGFQLQYSRPRELKKDGRTVFSYDPRTHVTDAGERRRVLEFWSAWWKENAATVLSKEADAGGAKDDGTNEATDAHG